MKDTSRFKNQDLVLKVTKNIDPAKFDVTKFEPFLDALCRDREYQKEAIRTVANFLFGGQYKDLRSLAEENYAANGVLQEKYPTFELFERKLEIPNRLACSIDLATGTGKSYIIYGLCRIALASGYVDRVLILCPSKTIEAGLLDKFTRLAADSTYTDLMPKGAVIALPHIVGATESVAPGGVCIENIHATYARTKSAIEDSFKRRGKRTLVLCDEAHHIFSPEQDELKKWKEFLVDDAYGFQYIVGLSGTCYIGNEYFADVISRYSLKQATDDRVVKLIDYVEENATGDRNEKLQLIFSNHKEAKQKYKLIRPLTIIVTKGIADCKRVTDELITFLAAQENISKEDAGKKVLRVHSPRPGSKDDKAISLNLHRLHAGEPDEKDSKIEWITSVSMLTEGWDVKNVFQIVPDEERAFNSKLLIAQVLGRGLRIPTAYATEQPVVTVFNHDSWSGNIRHLVSEVLEQDRRIVSSVHPMRMKFDFILRNIDYSRAEDVVETSQTSEYKFDMKYVNLAAQRKTLERETIYERALSGTRLTKKTRIITDMYSLDAVVADVLNRFKAIDSETGSGYAKKYTKPKIKALVEASLDRIEYTGNEVSKENRQRILSAFGNLQRPGSKSIRYKIEATSVVILPAATRPSDSIGTIMLRRGAAVFYDDLSLVFDPELTYILNEIEKDESLPKSSSLRVQNSFYFKTCLSVITTASEPERKFVRMLLEADNAVKVAAWIKSTDTGYYEIEYSYSKGDYSKRGVFNPDFFIALNDGKDILVVETKGDEENFEPSSENKGKRRAAITHFALLNDLQSEQKYHFCFCSPKDYDMLFACLQDGSAMVFKSSLDVALEG
jgi:type III restriction enzyme